MPALSFEVESYAVRTRHPSGGARWRDIRLTSPAVAHGIRHRAWVYFLDAQSRTEGNVINVDQPNYDGVTVVALVRMEDFDVWYDILRNEEPLTFTCHFGSIDDGGPGFRPLQGVALATGQEPPGEGSEAALATLQRLGVVVPTG